MNDADLRAALLAADATIGSTDPSSLALPVHACPGWTVEDLVGHLAQVHGWATRIILAAPGERVTRRTTGTPGGAAVLDVFADAAAGLADALAHVDLDREVHSFVGPRPVRWWLRRQAHEATIHAWDRQAADGSPDPIDAVLALDGIDELFDVFFDPRLVATDAFSDSGDSMHIHADEPGGEWFVRIARDSVEVTREHRKGDLALRGPAAHLLLVLWNRSRIDDEGIEVEAFGPVEVLARMQAAVAV